MSKLLPILFLFLALVPGAAEAREFSPFVVGRTLLVASSSPLNAYFAGGSVVHTGTVSGDLVVAGGSLLSTGLVRRDALFAGGSVRSQGAVGGDLRAVGGTIDSESQVAGDFIVGGYAVESRGLVEGDILVVGSLVTLLGGGEGSVVVYGNDVTLAGAYAGDVSVVAASSLTVLPGAEISGTLSYKAPVEANIAADAVIGHVAYERASFLPDAGTSRFIAGLSLVLFILIRILGALILAGLFAGLFPSFASVFIDRLYESRPRSVLLTTLLGFATIVVVPVLVVILLLTFVGIGLAMLLFVLYALLGMLSCLVASVMIGNALARRFSLRERVKWHDGVLGMLVLSIIVFIPLGALAAMLLMLYAAGSLLSVFFEFAFPRDKGEV